MRWKHVCKNAKEYGEFFRSMEGEYSPSKVYDCVTRPFPRKIDIDGKENKDGKILKVYIIDAKD